MKADRSLSNSARCSSVKNSWLAYFGERCRGVSVWSVQMPCRSGSPHGVVNAGADAVVGGTGAWAALGPIGPKMTAPDVAMTANIEPENLSRMMASICVQLVTPTAFPRVGGDETDFQHWPIAGMQRRPWRLPCGAVT